VPFLQLEAWNARGGWRFLTERRDHPQLAFRERNPRSHDPGFSRNTLNDARDDEGRNRLEEEGASCRANSLVGACRPTSHPRDGPRSGYAPSSAPASGSSAISRRAVTVALE
jgi:hypothetical protein